MFDTGSTNKHVEGVGFFFPQPRLREKSDVL